MENQAKQVKKAKRTKHPIALIVIICLVFFFASYIIYHIVQKSNSNIVTEVAYKETVYKTIDADCFVLRNEEFIKNSSDGTTVSFVKNGERVARGDTVSVVFSSSEDAASYLKIQELEKEIAHYEDLSGQANFQTLNIDSLTKKINIELNQYLDALDSGDYSLAIQNADIFRDSVTGKQIATGANLDFSEKLANLKNELSDLKSRSFDYDVVKTENAGYFIGGSDGYEKTLNFDDIDKLKADDIESAIKSKPAEVSDSVVGRTVSSFSWYIACVLDSDKTVDITYDKEIYLNFTEAGVEKLPVRLYKLGEEEDGKKLVIFSCDEMNESLSNFRIEKIEIITDEYTGLKISNSAIRTVDGEKGVYIVRGNLMGFRKIKIIYSTDKYTIVDNSGSSDYIKLYDKVVTEGVELYDNKLI